MDVTNPSGNGSKPLPLGWLNVPPCLSRFREIRLVQFEPSGGNGCGGLHHQYGVRPEEAGASRVGRTTILCLDAPGPTLATAHCDRSKCRR
jgi:hypothetical protein